MSKDISDESAGQRIGKIKSENTRDRSGRGLPPVHPQACGQLRAARVHKKYLLRRGAGAGG